MFYAKVSDALFHDIVPANQAHPRQLIAEHIDSTDNAYANACQADGKHTFESTPVSMNTQKS